MNNGTIPRMHLLREIYGRGGRPFHRSKPDLRIRDDHSLPFCLSVPFGWRWRSPALAENGASTLRTIAEPTLGMPLR